LPATVALTINMQLIAAELVTGPLLPPTESVQAAASADSIANGPNKAAPATAETSDVVARRPPRRRVRLPAPGVPVGVGPLPEFSTVLAPTAASIRLHRSAAGEPIGHTASRLELL
jgi:hypothetical protein